MTVIPDELIEQVRDAADIVTLIGEHVSLKRTGSDYRGPCPFHGGTHRNFAVIPKKQMYYCFVCNEGGDVFTFFMKKFGMDYPAAVRARSGMLGDFWSPMTPGSRDPT
jgi:DNA primase